MEAPAAPVPVVQKRPLETASITLGQENQEDGLALHLNNDGLTQPAAIDGIECRLAERVPGRNSYFYFAVDPAFKWAVEMDVAITVEYFDNGQGYFIIQYDGSNTNAFGGSAYVTINEAEPLANSGKWKKAYFLARKARFQNRQNAQSDFRLELHTPQLFVRCVTVIRLDLP